MPFRKAFSSKARPSTSDGQAGPSASKRRFPLFHRKKGSRSSMSSAQLAEQERPSTAMHSSTKGFRVRVQIRFESPLNSEYTRDYDASPRFLASDQMCQGLLSRLQHCSAELITRHDFTALDPLTKPRRNPKPLRYRISYHVERDGVCVVDKQLSSFQDQPLTFDESREVIAATDRIVALFMLRHDPGFRWAEPAEPEPFAAGPETVRPCTGRPQSTYCVPRARFNYNTQSHDFAPGYSLEVFLRSRCSTRYPESRNASLKVDSTQTTPLPVIVGEDLMSSVSAMLDVPIEAWKRHFDQKHRTCDGLEGSGGCQHIEDGAVDIMFKVRNNLGPDYTYFSHRIQTSKVLFNDPQARDFDDFTDKLKTKLEKARDATDRVMSAKDDLIVRVRDLRGEQWQSQDHIVCRLDSSVTNCRQSIDALMERLYTGISDVFEGHDVSATLLAHKRGHLIFDGVIGGYKDEDFPQEKFDSPELEMRAFQSRLKDRIRSDITMVCKDTCVLDCPEELPNLTVTIGGAAPSIKEPYCISDVPVPDSPSSSRHSQSLNLAKRHAQRSLRETTLTPNGEGRRVPSGVEMAKQYGYMDDYMADEENYSEPPSTPSLADTDSTSHHESVLTTPLRHHHQGNTWIRMVGENDPDLGLVGEEIPENEEGESALGIMQPLATPKEKSPQELPDTPTLGRDSSFPSEDSDIDSIAAPSTHESVDETLAVELSAPEPSCEGFLEHVCESVESPGVKETEEAAVPVVVVEDTEQLVDEVAASAERDELVDGAGKSGPVTPVEPVAPAESAVPVESAKLAEPTKPIESLEWDGHTDAGNESAEEEVVKPQDEEAEATLTIESEVKAELPQENSSTHPTEQIVNKDSGIFLEESQQCQDIVDLQKEDSKPEDAMMAAEVTESPEENDVESQTVPKDQNEERKDEQPQAEDSAIIQNSAACMDEAEPLKTPEPTKSPDSDSAEDLDDGPLANKSDLSSFAENKRQETDGGLLEAVPEVSEVQVVLRPIKTTPKERPTSTALTVRTPTTPFFVGSRPGTASSGDDDRPHSGVSTSSAWSQHRRQITSSSAGILGLNQSRLEVGLRNVVVPFHLRTLHKEPSFDDRPSSSHSNQSNEP